MRTIIKLIVFVVIIVVSGLIALPFVVDPNDYKQEISTQVEKATGRTLTLDGDIELSVFPWIALELGPLSLSNAKGFTADTFAQVQSAEIRIKLMPLLNKQLEMDTIILDGLMLNLEKNKVGKTNWDDLTSETNTKDSDKASKQTEKPDAGTPALAAISIAGVQLTNANILWSDASAAQKISLKNFNLTTDPLVPGEPTALDMTFDIESAAPQASAHIALKTNVMVDLENQQYALTGLSFTTQVQGSDLPFSTADISLAGDINADLIKQLVSIEDLSLAAKANKDKQTIDAQLTAQMSSNLATQQSVIKSLDLTAEIVDPALPTGKANIKLNADVNADLQNQTVKLSDLVLQVLDLMVKGDVNISKLLSDNPAVAGEINVDAFNLRQLAKQLAIELPPMADDTTLELVQLSTQFEGSSNSINAKSLNVTLDQSKLSGSIAVKDFAKPAINFKLALDEIDVDRYLPPVEEGEKSSSPVAPPAAAAAASASQLPLETLRQLNAKGVIDIGKLKVSGTRSENIHIELSAANGEIKLHPMSANLYQGQYQGNVRLDARGKTLKLAIDENLKGVHAGPLLLDLTGEDKISGEANAAAKLTGNGSTVEQIKQSLSGNGSFSFTNGALKGINIAESIRKAKAVFKGGKVAESDEPVQTDFSTLSGSFKATNGVIDNQDLLAMSPLLRITGAGLIDLANDAMNYGVDVSIVGTSKGQGGKELADLKGLTIPVKLKGSLSDPKISVDLASMLKDQAKEELKAKVTEKLEDKLGGDLGGLVGGLLGTDKQETASETEVQPDNETATTEQETAPEPAKSPEKQLEDAVKDKLKDKLKGFF
ncbi:membrane assembly protein AsmA [Methylophaga sp. 42_25_T18]|nr:membrane assembly protein AsmA [Methylophaga sp. 42_25_T18]OUR85425.1 membrane assembly protein AsmA [Methylophaga sp. 42_8_T64]